MHQLDGRGSWAARVAIASGRVAVPRAGTELLVDTIDRGSAAVQ